jgi:hypothetical protein
VQAKEAKLSVWATLFLAAAACAGRAAAQAQEGVPSPVVRIGETQEVCQLTGDMDWETGQPTAARTLTNFGLDATDLGYPVDHNGKLLLLFGDSWPPPHGGGPLAEVIPDDSVGVTTRTELPNPETCLDLVVHSKVEGGKKHAATVPPSSGSKHHPSRLPKAQNASLASCQHHLPEQIYIRWCCIDLSNAPGLPEK